MKKILLSSLLISGIAYGADSWVSSIGSATAKMALYPVKVLINKGPRFLEEESELYRACDTPAKQTTFTVLSTAAFTAGGLVLGAATLPIAAAGIVALDYCYSDDE